MKKIICLIFILFLLLPALVFSSSYSFKKFTVTKCTFIMSGTMSLISLFSGLHYQSLSDDAYENYENATDSGYASAYRINSEGYNSSAAFWKNVALYSGITAVVSFGLDYFIFGREKETHISFSIENDKPAVNVSMKF